MLGDRVRKRRESCGVGACALKAAIARFARSPVVARRKEQAHMTQRAKTKRGSRSAKKKTSRARVAKAASKTTRRSAAKASTTRKSPTRRWSAQVTKNSDAMTLEPDVFKRSPKAIAQSIKRSAEQSHRRKSPPFRSAMSMLTFYKNRAGKNLTAAQSTKLDRAKDELRKLFGRE
jgi:Protein of unknown function (DUF3175)